MSMSGSKIREQVAHFLVDIHSCREMAEKCSSILYENLISRFLLVYTLRFLVYSLRGNRFDGAKINFVLKIFDF